MFFEEHGWFVTKKVIPEDIIDRMFTASEEFYNGDLDAELPIAGCSNWKKGDPLAVRNNEYISFQKRAFHQLSLQPIIGAIAARLMDTDTVRYFQDQLVSKEPNHQDSTKVGWHTDCSYHSNCTSHKLLTVWIPLHDVDEEHEPLVIVDSSHKWRQTNHMRGFNQNNHREIEQSFIRQGKEFSKIPIVLKEGQISFHCSSLVHGSYQNRSNMMRRVIVLNVQDGDNRYRPFWNNGKQIHHYLDSLCRKQANDLPDYTDLAIFPVIWSDLKNNNAN
ncbi:phytanoyl-CoA dioxygenase [Pleurocapsa sp. CCALA 161]|uniref:phytanoyl-CoA dioxygenase family protein n=1 Tax=Pleurocapsa sp. CCALA 161 TaxID=2107688 RepID=UPI000D04E6C1|nr:phytanoyl-CoA dioxygenase family protein [Pleurocapsa sp. CCALA 161]PSB08475.1 phytanoyl-CoA dioxygenase [Pleurocapsa sp. CCALA 161]